MGAHYVESMRSLGSTHYVGSAHNMWGAYYVGCTRSFGWELGLEVNAD